MQVKQNLNHQDNDGDDESEKSSQAKKKWVVAVLLAVLLVAVLCQPDDEDPSADASQMISLKTDGETHPAAGATEQAGIVSSDAPRFMITHQLSRISLDEVLDSPLFLAERIEPRRVQPRPLTVQAIYGSDQQQSAILENSVGKNSIVRSGQPLPDGRRVLAVTTEGVQLGQ